MTPEQWRQVRDLFERILDLPDGAGRKAFLESACDDPFLRSEVESLLASHDDAGTRYERPLVDLAHEPETDTDTGRPHRLGPYEIDRALGEGGMGTVYAARRVDGAFERLVAIKILRRGLDTAEAVHRFEAERHILARLEHPGIARLLDGGSADDGRPYLVMEYVEGEPLADYCDRRSLTIEERLRLFLEICDAVQFAHQNLVIHRDLKPSNILVTADGHPKLLDFGIAKILTDDEDVHTVWVTRTGLGPMTPDFAAPEQLRGRPVTTATDVYALGLTLYHLLCGRAPYRVDTRRFDEMVRIVCEHVPAPPSERLDEPPATSRGDGSESQPAGPAFDCGLDSEALRRRLRGDLDAVVLHALRKDPESRYPSPAVLAADLRRHLLGYPVGARTAHWTYRLGKLLHRRRRSGAALLAVAAVVTMAWLSLRSGSAGDEPGSENETLDLMATLFTLPDPNRARGERVTARELLDAGATTGDRLPAESPAKARYLATMGRAYAGLGLFPEAAKSLRTAVELHLKLDDDAAAADASSRLGHVLFKLGELDEAETVSRQSLELRRRSNPWARPQLRRLGTDPVDDLIRLSDISLSRDRRDDAISHLDEALDMAEARGDVAVALQIERLRAHLQHPSGPALAGELEAMLARARAEIGESDAAVARLLVDLARAQRHQDPQVAYQRFQTALQILRQTEDSPTLALALDELARLHLELGRLRDAQITLSESLALKHRLYGRHHPSVAATLCLLGRVGTDGGRRGAAADAFRQAVNILAAETFPPAEPTAECFHALLLSFGNLNRGHEGGETAALLGPALAIPPHPAWPEPTRRAYSALEQAWEQTGAIR